MIDQAMLDELLKYNVIVREDETTITLAAACPTAAHRPVKVASDYVVTFRCPHGESKHVFCTPCTADRRAGVWACQEYRQRPDCPGSRVVRVTDIIRIPKEKP